MSESAKGSNARAQVGVIDKYHLVRGLFNTEYFRRVTRPRLYKRAENDPEKVHELTLDLLKGNERELKMISLLFNHDPSLKVKIKGREMIPFGNAAGLDKTGDALKSLSNFFGFLEPGTITVNYREGNKRPRVAAHEGHLDLYNAQGFPNPGLEYFKERLVSYKRAGYKTPVYTSICGLPTAEENAVEVAMTELEELVKSLKDHTDGFVWNCFSPNTAALKVLRTPDIFEQSAVLIKRYAPGKPLFVKIGPYEKEEKAMSMKLVGSFLKGGGDGVITTNTKMHSKEHVPMKEWGYPTAGRSGKFLKPYRLRSVAEIRKEFPESIIIATGGIYDGDDAYETFKAGANMLEGYTPYTFYGIGLLKELEKGVSRRMKADGYSTLQEMQAAVREKR